MLSSDMTGVLIKRGNQETDTHRGKVLSGQMEKTAIYKPRKEAQDETDPADTLILDLQAS